MRRIELFAILLAILVFISNFMLVVSGESRADVYLSLSILIYYILYSILPPLVRTRGKGVTYLNASLFIIFLGIVSYRVYQVLSP